MSMTIDIATPVGQLVTERPARAKVFEQHGIDYCCGGKLPLEEACKRRGADPAKVSEALAASDAADSGPEENWAEKGLAELAEHITKVHHDYLRAELPRLALLTEKVARVHGDHAPETVDLHAVFMRMKPELEMHTMKEEQILFPFIRQIESGEPIGAFPPAAIAEPIRCMESEHDDAGAALARMRALTDDYTPPMDACNSWRVLYDSLHRLEKDMHIHIHKENNILFPRTLKAAGL